MTVVKEFGADQDLKKLYQVYLAIVLAGGFLWWMVPVVVVVMHSFEVQIGVAVALSSFVPLILAAGFVLYRVSKFHSSITYILEDDKITVTKGVWWKTKSGGEIDQRSRRPAVTATSEALTSIL